jgi:hypothetical protein
MKKALVFLLILAVAGGLFAQGWTFGAGASSGIHNFVSKTKVDGDVWPAGENVHSIGLQNADGDAYGSGTISATYEGAEGGKFVLKLGTGSIEAGFDVGDPDTFGFSGYLINKFLTDSTSGTVSTRPDYAYGWVNTFGGAWKLYAGIFSGDGDDGAVGDFQYAANENVGIINVFKPISDLGLTIGFGIGDNRDITDGDDWLVNYGGPNWSVTPGGSAEPALGDLYFPIGVTFLQPETFQLKVGYQTIPITKDADPVGEWYGDDSLYFGLDLLLLDPISVGVSVELNNLENYGDWGQTTIAEYIKGTALDDGALSYSLTLEERLWNADGADLEFLAYAKVGYAISDVGGGTLTPSLGLLFGSGATVSGADARLTNEYGRAASGDFETDYDHDWIADQWNSDALAFGIKPALTFAFDKASFTLGYDLLFSKVKDLSIWPGGPAEKGTNVTHSLYFLVDIAF